jgi:hypothetical protein
MSTLLNRMLTAMNDHDVDAFVACFAADYRSEQPAHPARAFVGSDKVRENWTGVFAGVPDFRAELLATAIGDHGVQIGEWHWSGTHVDGAPFDMRGVTVLGVEGDRIAWARLYMEATESHGADIDQMVKDTYRPPE